MREKLNYYLLIVFTLLIGSFNLNAQVKEPKFEHISTEEGLSQSTVYSICQDYKGFLWFGTQDGLNRYDGSKFVIYKNDPEDSASISYNDIWSIFEDSNNNLWIGTYGGGLNLYDRLKNNFVSFINDPEDSTTITNNDIWTIYEPPSKPGILYIGTSSGLNIFNTKTRTAKKFSITNSLISKDVRNIIEDKNGNLWIGTKDDGLFLVNSSSQIIQHYKTSANAGRRISNNKIWSLKIDKENQLWVGTYGGGINVIDLSSLKVIDTKLNLYATDSQIWAITEDQEGSIWISANDGLIKYEPDSRKTTMYNHKSDKPESLSDNDIRSFFEDNSGVLWIGTASKGLNKYNPSAEQFIHYKNDPENLNSLSDNNVRAFCEDNNGNIWIGTFGGGLNKFNTWDNTFSKYINSPQNPNSLSNNNIWSLLYDEGILWIGTSGGLNRFDIATNKFSFYIFDKSNSNSLANNYVLSIAKDNFDSDILWLGTSGGLSRLNKSTNEFINFKHSADDSLSLTNNMIYSIMRDSKGNLWAGTMGGLNKFNDSTGTFRRYCHDDNNPNSISHNTILTIYEDSYGLIWIGTYGGGLNSYNPTTGIFINFSEEDGLPNNVIYGITEAENNNLWLSTNNGLARFNLITLECKSYNVKDGLQSNEFNNGAYFKGNDGSMFFGGNNGFNTFQPNNVIDNPHLPDIVITDFQIFNQSVLPDGDSPLTNSISETSAIELSYKDYVFSFEFSALDFRMPEKNQYAYRMIGLEDNWNYIGSRRYITFTTLPPGDYTLQVKGSNNDGVWNETGTSIAIEVTPPFWQTWYAYTFYFLFVIGVILGYVRYKTQTQAKELERQKKELEQERLVAERLRQVDKLKDEFLANTSHELRTPLNGIIGIAESLVDSIRGKGGEKVKENLSMIVGAGKRLATLVNSILDFSKLKEHDIELTIKPVDIRALTSVVLKLSEPLISGKDLILLNQIAEDIPSVAGDENRLMQIMHNLVGNAIKFSEEGKVTVNAKEDEKFIKISVTDTGIGIPEEKFGTIFQSFEQVDASTSRTYGGTGLGLAITKKLIELQGGNISLQSKVGSGSTFTFTMPSSSEKAQAEKIEDDKITTTLMEEIEDESAEIDIDASPAQRDELHGNFKILVVDDEELNQQVLGNHLSLNNYIVTKALNGEAALKLIEKGEKFDIILLDIMMPRMSGYEVCHKIREKYLPNELPVIMLTAKNQVADLVEGFSSGANDYITKPFSKNELFARINTQLNLLKINSAYERFVPHEFLWTLGRKNIIDVKLGDQVQGEMSILFSDIRSFTTISEGMTPKENFDFLNNYLQRVTPAIRNNKGFIDKYIGDAIMALFPTSADDAVTSAIEILEQVDLFNQDDNNKLPHTLQVGIGIHTGSIMLGTLGDSERMDGTVISDAVNLSSRLEGLTKIFGASIIISDTTLAGLKDAGKFNYRSLGKVCVKGKKKRLEIYEILDCCPDKKLKIETKEKFEKGLELFTSGDFDEAASNFKSVLVTNPNDSAAKFYSKRIEQYKSKKLEGKWEGVEIFDTK